MSQTPRTGPGREQRAPGGFLKFPRVSREAVRMQATSCLSPHSAPAVTPVPALSARSSCPRLPRTPPCWVSADPSSCASE